ncbi:hypothetical protein [Pseudomonas sp. BJa3]|uniref:hypothetical protein n=1 Tax=Pseudomonas sp. BJa3 TaxID=2986525 RepID=UPI002265CE40|nr:hypothetical protein [Pseudomonas sp. BJa3]MCX5508381.1 hypothetical protein [Pseudomonas sp. BJa3]
MANSVSIDGYLHVEGFDQFDREAFNKRKIRAGMRKVGQLITGRAQMNLALGGGQDGYPVSRSGATIDSIGYKVSRAGFLVRISPTKTSSMKEFYPAYLHYGVRMGSRVRGRGPGMARRARGKRQELLEARRQNDWRIAPRDNYMTDALVDSRDEVRRILQQAFAAALLN